MTIVRTMHNSTAKRHRRSEKQDDIISCIEAMRSQEAKNYNFARYCFLQGSTNTTENNDDLTDEPTDALCRTKMIDWAYTVVDSCDFSRSNVFVAASNLDRYLSTPAGIQALHDRKEFQLLCMTSIYSAIKINEVETLTPQGMAHVSRGDYTAKEIEACELNMLTALNWHVNPPSTSAFFEQYAALLRLVLQEQCSDVAFQDHQELSKRIFDNASVQVELASRQYSFVGIEASKIALAAVLNAMTSVKVDAFANYGIDNIKNQFCAELGVEIESIVALCDDLLHLFTPSPDDVDKDDDDAVYTSAASQDDHTRDESFDSSTSFNDVTKTNVLADAAKTAISSISPKSVRGPTPIHSKHPLLSRFFCGILDPLRLLKDQEE